MSSFNVTARRVSIVPIENANALELALIEGTTFVSVVPKSAGLKDGDTIIYIPEQSILPDSIISDMNLVADDGKTMLAGGTILEDGTRKRDRVKALRLRGQVSQGLCYSPGIPLVEGEDYAEQLGITKWAPPVPASMSGKVEVTYGMSGYTNLENIKYYPDTIKDGEEIIATEKIHGSSLNLSLIDGELAVASKGFASRGMSLVDEKDAQGNSKNLYWQAAHKINAKELLTRISEANGGARVTIFAEVFGAGVQDLAYGSTSHEVRAFDIRIGEDYLDYDEFVKITTELGIPIVPLIYRGPFSLAKIEEVAVGREQVSGKEACIREGVVVKPTTERRDPELGRVALKVISPKYLTRKGETTEYE